MKIYKLLSFFIVTFFITTSVQAQIEPAALYSNWEDTTSDDAILTFINRMEEPEYVRFFIDKSRKDRPRFYIENGISQWDMCVDDYMDNSISTMYFNGKPIKMIEHCVVRKNKRAGFFSNTPYTDEGHDYVVNLFKKSTKPIKLQKGRYILHAPVKGFTKTWNSPEGKHVKDWWY